MSNQTIPKCAYCGNQDGGEEHHLLKRSTSPELIDDPKNKVRLCWKCHRRTQEDPEFHRALQQIFFYWRPINAEMFLRAEASLEALLEGKEIEFATPAMVDHYLRLAGASYAHYSEMMSWCEKGEAEFFVAMKSEGRSNGEIKMEWGCTEKGKEMIDFKRKLKSLEKLQSNMRASLKRFETERFNAR